MSPRQGDVHRMAAFAFHPDLATELWSYAELHLQTSLRIIDFPY